MIKFSINLPDDTVQALRELAERRQVSVTHALRQAIATEAYLDEQIRQGAKILIEIKGRVKEIVWR